MLSYKIPIVGTGKAEITLLNDTPKKKKFLFPIKRRTNLSWVFFWKPVMAHSGLCLVGKLEAEGEVPKWIHSEL